jgi:hypothetical protein
VVIGSGAGAGLEVFAGGPASVLTAARASIVPLPTTGSHPAGG